MSKKKTKRDAKPATAPVVSVGPKRRMVILKELVGRLQPFNLPHEQYCAARGDCTCTVRNVLQSERDPQKRGATRKRMVRILTPKSITLLPNKESEPMDAAVLLCPEVQAAMPGLISYRDA